MSWNNLPKKQFVYEADGPAAEAIAISTTDTYVTSIWVTNKSGAARTLEFENAAATPKSVFTVTLNGTDQLVWHTEKKPDTALFFEGGITITPDGTGLYVQVLGRAAGAP